MNSNQNRLDLQSTLLLVPTQLEYDLVEDQLKHAIGTALRPVVCGFGPISSGIETGRILAPGKFSRVLLLGIAGTYDEHRLAVGSATSFFRVGCFGVGVGQGNNFLRPSEIGLPQCPIGDEDCFDELPLNPVLNTDDLELLTVCSAASDSSEVEERRQKFPDAVAEDMEGFSVALAAAKFGIPTTVIRGISNVAGDRNKTNWQIESALSSAVDLLSELVI